jgi:hypothetical protein
MAEWTAEGPNIGGKTALIRERVEDNAFRYAHQRWIDFSEGDGKTNRRRRKYSGRRAAAPFCQRVEDNAFHLAHFQRRP